MIKISHISTPCILKPNMNCKVKFVSLISSSNNFLVFYSYYSKMTSILSTFSADVISQVITEFHKPTTLQPTISEEITNTPEYQEALLELSKLHEITRKHPPEIAFTILKENNVPDSIIKLLLKQNTDNDKQLQSNYNYAWRLDQSVPNVQAILLNITNKNTGEVKTMRMDLSTFHKLRYNVSLLIKEHSMLEKRVNK